MNGRVLSPKELIAAKNSKAQSPPPPPASLPTPPLTTTPTPTPPAVVETRKNEQKLDQSNEEGTPNKNENLMKMSSNESPLPSDLSLTLECVRKGKEGWLYRENECYRHDDDEYQQKIWVVVMEGRFSYSLHRPSTGTPMDFLGYLDLNFHSDCRILEKKTEKCLAKFCFRIKDQGTSVILFATTEQERSDWMEIILEATRGIHHFNPSVAPAINRSSSGVTLLSSTNSPSERKIKRQLSRSSSAVQMGYKIVEYPKMTGPLKKKSIEGKTLGFKNTKSRWFRLECGEIKYFKSEQFSPENLKGVFQLRGCMMPNGEANEGDRISITRSDGFSLMMSAKTVEIAREWRAAIKETLDLLDEIYGDSRSTSGKIRRSNLSTASENEVESHKRESIEKSAITVEILSGALSSHFLLQNIQDLTALLNCLQQHVYLSGDVILWQDAIASDLLIIESGQVDVIKDNKFVAKLGSGKLLNELTLINDITLSSTIRANMTVIIWSLERKILRHFLKTLENNFKSQQINFLKTVTMFEKLNENMLRQIANVLQIATYEQPHERIIRQGEVGDKFYLLVQGRVSVTKNSTSSFTTSSSSSLKNEIAQLSSGQYFGELALISNEPRKANVVVLEAPVVCYTIDKQNFTSVIGTLQELENENFGIEILKKVKILESLSEKQLQILVKCLEMMTFSEGMVIISQGEEDGDRFFIIVSGEVIVSVNHIEVARLKSGSYFGEMALMNNERRNATITAVDEVICLTLNRAQFVKFLGPLDEILKEEAHRREEEAKNQGLLGTARRFTKNFTQSFASRRSTVKKVTGIGAASNVEYDLDEFEHIRTLGYGRFGAVKLVRRQGHNGVYALKIQFKEPLVDLNLQMSPYVERDLLQFFDHPFIPAIYATFQDQNCFYLLLEAIPGGDFWNILYDRQSWTKLESKTHLGGLSFSVPDYSHFLALYLSTGLQFQVAKFYFANILCAIEYLHNHEVIYRDLKPENMVMERTGYLKLVDFGSAKKLSVPNLTNTLCGTPEYLAPEMITAKGHNHAVDYWALGIFLYELICGKTPFEHNDMGTIYHSILSAEKEFPSHLKSLALDSSPRDLLLNLLKFMPGLRLGMLRNGIADIWNHPFLSEIAPEAILNKAISPPIRPDIEHLLQPTPLDDLDIEMDFTFSRRMNFPDF